MPRKAKEPQYPTTEVILGNDFETPLVKLALEHEIVRAKQFAKASRDAKKKLFHETVGKTYQSILDVLNSPE